MTGEGEPVWRAGLYVAGDVEVSTDRARLDRAVILNTLSETYWAGDLGPDQVLESVANALPFGLYTRPGGRQIGFARVVTDMTRFAWLSDVFVIDAFRGRGYGSVLLRAVLSYPPLAPVYTWTLGTRDAQAFYEQFGFRSLPGNGDEPGGDTTMQLKRPRRPGPA